MEAKNIGFAFCGSFCTMDRALDTLEQLAGKDTQIWPVVSETVASTDTRFGHSHDVMREMERICGRRVIDTGGGAGTSGHRELREALVIGP